MGVKANYRQNMRPGAIYRLRDAAAGGLQGPNEALYLGRVSLRGRKEFV